MNDSYLPPRCLLRTLTRTGSALLLLASSACASTDGDGAALPWGDEPGSETQGASPSLDASVDQNPVSTSTSGTPSRPTGSSSTTSATDSSSSSSSASGSASDAGTRRDAATSSGGNALDDLLDGLLGDSDAAPRPNSGDGGGSASGDWKLEPDSAAECPPEPPPIPIIGGACLGLYYTCNWKNSAGESYFCTCDWVHWLCI